MHLDEIHVTQSAKKKAGLGEQRFEKDSFHRPPGQQFACLFLPKELETTIPGLGASPAGPSSHDSFVFSLVSYSPSSNVHAKVQNDTSQPGSTRRTLSTNHHSLQKSSPIAALLEEREPACPTQQNSSCKHIIRPDNSLPLLIQLKLIRTTHWRCPTHRACRPRWGSTATPFLPGFGCLKA